MKIEVGKAYRTRDGQRATIHNGAGDESVYRMWGQLDGDIESWTEDGIYWKALPNHPLDLISHCEDSPTQIKSESKMPASEKPEMPEIKKTITTEIRISRKDLQEILCKHFNLPRGQIQTDEGVWLEDFTFIDHEEVSTVPAPIKRSIKRSIKRAGGE